MTLPNPIPQGGRPMGITTWTLRVHYQKCGQTTAMKKYDRYMRTFLCARSNFTANSPGERSSCALQSGAPRVDGREACHAKQRLNVGGCGKQRCLAARLSHHL